MFCFAFFACYLFARGIELSLTGRMRHWRAAGCNPAGRGRVCLGAPLAAPSHVSPKIHACSNQDSIAIQSMSVHVIAPLAAIGWRHRAPEVPRIGLARSKSFSFCHSPYSVRYNAHHQPPHTRSRHTQGTSYCWLDMV